MIYDVKTKFILEGVVEVEANSKKQATEFVENHVGMNSTRGVHTSLSDKEIPDWLFPVNADKTVYTPTEKK